MSNHTIDDTTNERAIDAWMNSRSHLLNRWDLNQTPISVANNTNINMSSDAINEHLNTPVNYHTARTASLKEKVSQRKDSIYRENS